MDTKKQLLLIGFAVVIAIGVTVVMKRPQEAVQAPVAETTAPAAAPTEAAPADAAAPAASEAPACTQYNWDGTAWVCTSSAAVPGTAGSN